MNTTEQFERAAVQHGCRIDMVNGRMHYISVTGEGIAMIGPQAQRRKGWRWPYKKHRPAARCSTYLNARADDPALVRIMHSEVDNMLRELQHVNSVETPLPSAPQPTPSKWMRFKERWTSRFYDQEWHTGMRNVAGDVLMWTVTAFLVVVLAKGALWLLSL